jgi:hypothetical protein
MKPNWASIFGNVDLSANEIALVSTLPPLHPAAIPRALVRSNIQFEQGTIALEVKLPDPDARCQIGLSIDRGGELFAGINNLGALYGFAISRDNQWKPLAGAGYGASLESERWYKLTLTVKGSVLELYLDGVRVASAIQQIMKGPISILLESSGNVIVRNVSVDSRPTECFIVMQFTDEYNALYREVIRPTCEAFGYKVVRGDDTYTSGLIINDITQSIQEASIVIADITPNNPNVFYEVGYAHGMGKTTILLSDKKRERLPFDVSGFRTLFYDNTIAGKGEVKARLKRHLEGIAA